MPFFTLDKPFSKLLIALAQGDAKINSIFNKIGIGESYGYELVEELIENEIITLTNSRESPLKAFPKQLIKKELRGYTIQPKLYFTKPFYRFWFAFVEASRDLYGNIDIDRVLTNYKKYGYRLSSLLFEQLSQELLLDSFKEKLDNAVCGSYWDRFSEFDIYCQSQSLSVVGECKYTSRPITKAELIKLEAKIVQSSLRADYIALFSKSGFSHELHKINNSQVLLFEMQDFKKLLF